MRVLFVAAEASPLVKVGGLADVVGSLPLALTRLGHDVRLVIPQYGSVDVTRTPPVPTPHRVEISMAGGTETARLNVTSLKNEVPVYMVESMRYFGDKQVYGGNDLERFLFFSRAVCDILPQLEWQPEIVHCHDWHSSLVVMWLKKRLHPAATVFTIHNLAYQGAFDREFLVRSSLAIDWDYPAGAPETSLTFMSQGILWADLVTTVSETYAREILTPENGEGLDPLLRFRQKSLVGIVNGIDYDEYNPATDRLIAARYDPSTLERRTANKLALQKRTGLPENPYVPLVGMVQRLDEQKGIDILEPALPALLDETGAQFVILGRGRKEYEAALLRIAESRPARLALSVAFDDALAHLIYAGCDMFLMPSRFEPCGLGQMIAMRYGALPVVRHTGGLADTVPELSEDLSQGNGFVFREYSPGALTDAVRRGMEAFKNRKAWRAAVQRVMKLDFSWRASAMRYDTAYRGVKKAG